MSPTRRGLLLLLAAAPALALGGLAYVVGLAWVCFVVTLLVADRRRAPGADDLRVERLRDRKLSLGAANRVTLRISNRSRHPFRGFVRDEFPEEFLYDEHTLTVEVPPHETRDVSYAVTPLRRGRYRFGDVHLRGLGPGGVAMRADRIPAGDEVRVYPNLLQIRRYELLARRDRAHHVGLRNVRRRGGGTEIERLREYTSDDEYRQIDWKATARRHVPIAREFEAERSQDVLFLLDAGRLMGSPLGDLTRLDHAINATLLACWVAALRGDRVGVLAFSDRVLLDLPPRKGKSQFFRAVEALYDLQPEPTEPDFERATLHLSTRRRRRSLVVLFTELIHPETSRALLRSLAGPMRRHLPLCVTAADPEAIALRDRAPRSARDVDRRAVADRVLREKEAALEMLRRRGVLVLDVPADRLSAAVVNRYLEVKARSML